MASLSFNRVWKRYPNGVTAVRELTLEIADGRFVVLVGPSGGGKSTALRMVAGLEAVSEGTISIGGRVVNDAAPKDRDVAMVFQHLALYPHMTVAQNMAFSLKLRGMERRRIAEQVRRAAALLGIEELLSRKPRQLSGGEQQRVALGRAIVREPRVFLFDEPLSNLDAQLRVELRGEVRRLRGRLGTTMVYVTHDQEEAMTLGEELAVLKEGVLQQVGTPEEVYDRPANRFVAGFIGTPAMSFVTGCLVAEGAELAFEGSWGRLALGSRQDFGEGVRTGDRTVMGIRPESIKCGDGGAEGTTAGGIRATVGEVEVLGDRAHIHLRGVDGSAWVARTVGRARPVTGEAVIMLLDTERVHFFQPGENGKRVAWR